MKIILKIYFTAFLIIYLLMIILAVFEYVPPHNYDPHSLVEFEKSAAPSAKHLLGTSYYGEDIYTRFIYGAKTSFYSGMIVAITYVIAGIMLGIGSAYSQAKWTFYIEKISEVVNSFPKLLIVFLILGLFEVKVYLVLFYFGLISAPKLAELLKAKIRLLRKEEFIDASVALGLSWFKIIFKHILWYNSRITILSQFLYMYTVAVILEASLSYIGFGFKYDEVSWGSMLNGAFNTIHLKDLFTYPW